MLLKGSSDQSVCLNLVGFQFLCEVLQKYPDCVRVGRVPTVVDGISEPDGNVISTKFEKVKFAFGGYQSFPLFKQGVKLSEPGTDFINGESLFFGTVG